MIPLLLTWLAAPGATADVSVGVGAASNPYEMPADPAESGAREDAPQGGFVPVDAVFRWRRSGDAVRVIVEGDFEGVFFGLV